MFYELNVLIIKVDGIPLNSNLFDSCMSQTECYGYVSVKKNISKEIGNIPTKPVSMLFI